MSQDNASEASKTPSQGTTIKDGDTPQNMVNHFTICVISCNDKVHDLKLHYKIDNAVTEFNMVSILWQFNFRIQISKHRLGAPLARVVQHQKSRYNLTIIKETIKRF